MKKLALLFIPIFICSISFTKAVAQNGISISGTIKDNAGKALTHATVSLLKAKDSSLIKTELTDEDGKFEIKTFVKQPYLLMCTHVGYLTKYSEAFTPEKNFDISMTIDIAGKKLQEVTVTATKPMIEIKADRTVFNVEGSINAQGSNALELLQKSPGVRVDNNDNISMKGKTGVKIYIDGKMS